MKQCTKCQQWKNESEFYKRKETKDGLVSNCKECLRKQKREYYKENRDSIKQKVKSYQEDNSEWKRKLEKEWRENNKNYIKQYNKEWAENNKNYIKRRNKEYYENNKKEIKQKEKERYENNKEEKIEYQKDLGNLPLKYNSETKMKKEIELYEEIRESSNGNVEVECANCNGRFEPTKLQIKNRLRSINGKWYGENKLYCSNKCKKDCPVFQQKKYPKYHKPYLVREVQPELSKMVVERDEYTCIICQRHQGEIEVHCHHIEGIHWNPTESADMDICVTLCKDCHNEVHNQPGCKYSDMKCPT